MCVFCFPSGVVLENFLPVLYHHTGGVGLWSQVVRVVAEVIFRLDVLPIYFVIMFVKYHIRIDDPEESLILEHTLKFRSFKKTMKISVTGYGNWLGRLKLGFTAGLAKTQIEWEQYLWTKPEFCLCINYSTSNLILTEAWSLAL